METFTIKGVQYKLSELQMKHLKKITSMLADPTTEKNFISRLTQWNEFITYSIQVEQPNFNPELLDELTVKEYTALWQGVQRAGGITITSKGNQADVRGETKPKDQSTGQSYTDGAQSASAGHTETPTAIH